MTATRSGGALAEEFDLAARVWSIPAERMKRRKPHRVPLSSGVVFQGLPDRPTDGAEPHGARGGQGRHGLPLVRVGDPCHGEGREALLFGSVRLVDGAGEEAGRALIADHLRETPLAPDRSIAATLAYPITRSLEFAVKWRMVRNLRTTRSALGRTALPNPPAAPAPPSRGMRKRMGRGLAEEYDAAQERGEVKRTGGDRTVELPNSDDLGLRRDEIHEARRLRDEEQAARTSAVGMRVGRYLSGGRLRDAPNFHSSGAVSGVRVFSGFVSSMG
ncbi:MAG: hypothetical protein ACXIUV_06035 [Alkalilacustris sp.]